MPCPLQVHIAAIKNEILYLQNSVKINLFFIVKSDKKIISAHCCVYQWFREFKVQHLLILIIFKYEEDMYVHSTNSYQYLLVDQHLFVTCLVGSASWFCVGWLYLCIRWQWKWWLGAYKGDLQSIFSMTLSSKI